MIMKFDEAASDELVLVELGQRLTRLRLTEGLTQAQLAEQGGLAKRTLERMEAGKSTQLLTLIRVLRVLGLLEGLEFIAPVEEDNPSRQRATSRKAAVTDGEPRS